MLFDAGLFRECPQGGVAKSHDNARLKPVYLGMKAGNVRGFIGGEVFSFEKWRVVWQGVVLVDQNILKFVHRRTLCENRREVALSGIKTNLAHDTAEETPLNTVAIRATALIFLCPAFADDQC